MSSGQEVGQIFGEGSGPATALLRSPTVIIASVGLWGMNVYLFRLFGIDYVRVLNLDLVKEREQQQREAAQGGGAPVSATSVICGGGGSDHAEGPDEDGNGSDEEHGDASATNDNGKADEGGVEMMMVPSRAAAGPSSMPGSELIERHAAQRDDTPDSPSSTVSGASCSTAAGHASGPGTGDVTAARLLGFSVALLMLLHWSADFWINTLGGSTIGAIFAFYGAVTVGIVVPLPSTLWIRKACVTVLQRAFELFNPRCACVARKPPRPIPFIDVFFADAMCSLSKVFFDWGMLWHLASHYPDPVPASTHSIVIPSLCASLPYIIRARQCIIMHTVGKLKNDPKRYQHLLNALKYSTSLFPLCVSAYQKTVSSKTAASLENFLVILLTINSLYAFAWDVVMDWGMMQNPTAIVETTCVPSQNIGAESKGKSCAHSVLRPRLRFGSMTSTVILVVDAVLRFSWLLRFREKALFPNSDSYILCTQFLEAFRRAIWNLLRVEWENIKQMKAKRLTIKAGSFDEDDERISFLAPKPNSMMASRPSHTSAT